MSLAKHPAKLGERDFAVSVDASRRHKSHMTKQQLGKASIHMHVCDMGEHDEETPPRSQRLILLPVTPSRICSPGV